MKEKFEDILKERLQFEEHDYDPKGWEAYQKTYGDKKVATSVFKINRLTLLMFLSLASLTLLGWYANTQFNANDNLQTSIILNNKNDDLISKNVNQINSKFDSSNKKSAVILEDPNELQLAQNKTKNTLANQNKNIIKNNINNSNINNNTNINDNSGRKFKANKSDLISKVKVPASTNSNSEKELTQVSKGKKQQQLKVDEITKNEEINLDDKTQFEVKSEMKNERSVGNYGSVNSQNGKLYSNEIQSTAVSGVRENLLLSNFNELPTLDLLLGKNRVPIEYFNEFTKVLGKPRSNFYLGVGYITTFKQRESEFDLYPFSPSIFKIGLDYNLTYNTSLTFELNVNYQQYLNMSKDFNFYNQTATNFWYFELVAQHRGTGLLELPILFNYHILDDAIRFYGGGSLSFGLSRIVNTNLSTNLTYNQIDEFGLPSNYSQYLNPFNASFIVGVRVPIFKWLHIDARINKGITDMSNDSFWDAGIDTNDYFNISTHINF